MTVTLFRTLPTDRRRSMERYADALARSLGALGCRVRTVACPRPFARLRGRCGALADHLWRTTVYPRRARAWQGDVNHVVDHSYAHLLAALDAGRTVVTCHDLAPLECPERGLGLSRTLWRRAFRALGSAAHVVADSAFTRDALLRHGPWSAERVTVVPLAVDETFFVPAAPPLLRALRDRHRLGDRPVLLHVGSCRPRKSVETALEALALLGGDAVLVQVGGAFDRTQRRRIAALGVAARIRQISYVPEEELRAWYGLARTLVVPSLYEGFGLPVLEAMAAGTPVVCARAAALPEVAGDAALLVPPRDPRTLAAALETVLADPERARELGRRGRVRAAAFTWERTARATRTVYAAVDARA